MIDRTITLPLGGKERTLLFGVMGYFEYIKEATGKDPLEWLTSFDKMRAEGQGNILLLIKDMAVFVYAGLNSWLDANDQPNIPIEKVSKWCNGVDSKSVGAIIACAFGSFNEQQGEPGAVQPGQENGSEVNKKVSA